MAASPSLREFAADLNRHRLLAEARGDWALVLLYRAPGAAMAWLFSRMGIGPLAVTWLGLVASLAMPVFAWGLPYWMTPWVVLACAIAFQILDCADGTLARITGQVSNLGADLDFFVGMTHYLCLYPSIGLLADRLFDSGFFWTAIGAVAVGVRLLARIIRDRVVSRLPQTQSDGASTFGLADVPLSFLAGLSGVIAFGALAGPYLGWVVIALLAYSILDVVDAGSPMRGTDYPR